VDVEQPVSSSNGEVSLSAKLAEAVRFFFAFLKEPATMGALVPSSRILARAMLDLVDLGSARTVVELGPGTGAITGPILDRTDPSALLLAMELNQKHVEQLRRQYPRMKVFSDSAQQLPKYLRRHRVSSADIIISGLPWTNMPLGIQEEILDAVVASMHESSVFMTFGYTHVQWMPGARRFQGLLRKRFGQIERTRTIWRNVPPALVHVCRGPIVQAQSGKG
jgi:phospholipid N-methyltransferase